MAHTEKTSDDVPDHPLPKTGIGIQGPNVAPPPQIKSTAITVQEWPDHPLPYVLRGVAIPNVAAEPEAEDESLLHELPVPDFSTLPFVTSEAREVGWHNAVVKMKRDRARLTGRLIPGCKPRPIDDGIREAMIALWPRSGIPPQGLKAKERNRKILDWLKRHNRSIPAGDHALAKAVSRALKSLKQSL